MRPHELGLDGTPSSYEPYVREARIWADLFATVLIWSPREDEPISYPVASYNRTNVKWMPVNYASRNGVQGRLSRLVQLPHVLLKIWRAITMCDLVHLRSPGHLDLVAAAFVRLRRKPSLTKWAGKNGPIENERLPSRLDRWLQGRPNSLHPVLVYGPAQRSHQVSFIPALMSNQELIEARELSRARRWQTPWQICSVGRLDPIKGFDLALRGLAVLRSERPDLEWTYTMVGDGSERTSLERLAAEAGISNRVRFAGSFTFDQARRQYSASHIALMPGTKEGWPKVIAEAWAHGCVPAAARGGITPDLIQGDGGVGRVFEATPVGLARTLSSLLDDPYQLRQQSEAAFDAAQRLSLEVFKNRLEQLLAISFPHLCD